MKQHDFIAKNKENWVLFEKLALQDKLVNDFDLPKMYRQICHDLATAKARQYSPDLIQQLNALLLLGQSRLYKPSNRVLGSIVRFFTKNFKQGLIDIRLYVIWAHILFYGPAITAFAIVTLQPENANIFVDSGTISSIERMYNPNSSHFAKERPSDSDFLMFGHYIRNNISIAFQCFVGGILLGLGSLFYLVYNALFFGAISGHIVNIDYNITFFSFVVTHGAFELTAIVLSGAAGGVMGKHLIAPGEYSRLASLKLAGKRTFSVVIGCFILLVLAAFVEAFWSSSQTIPAYIKYIVGGLCWVWILSFVFRRGNNATR
ncbi:stage II sporulation protein M [Agaribacter flavus]|uniref:Stage II sporulation protein M n=1 Tax=Agaribacter flavus TaxID=1902781 RepID=A0ABV7FLC1_9ALTE